MAEMDGAISADNALDVKPSMIATWSPIPKLTLTASLLDENRKTTKTLRPIELPLPHLDAMVTQRIKAEIPPNRKRNTATG